MDLLQALAPIGLALILIVSGRVSVAGAGCWGAGAALALAWLNIDFAAAAEAAGRGLWIAWQAVSIIVAGLIFQRTALAAAPNVFRPAGGAAAGDERGRAFAAVFLLGVFVESASGFGLGAVAAAAVLQAGGQATARVAALALLSLALVPWGALAIGTGIAAGLTGLPIASIGVESARLSAPVLAAALVLFWIWAPGRRTARAMATEALWLAALLGLLWAANWAGAVDVAGVIAAGLLFALRWATDRSRGRPALTAAPFALFAIVIVALRLAPGATPALSALWSIRPWSDLPAFAPLSHASLWLLIVAGAYALANGLGPKRIGGEIRAALRAAWIPTLVTASYVVLGEAMSETGATATIAAGVNRAAGAAAPYASPIFAGLAGWLTGSNAAAHGMLVELQAAVGEATASDPLAVVSVQNVVASAFTMFSPMRVALVAAALGLAGQESVIVRRLAPFALAVLIVGWAAIAFGP